MIGCGLEARLIFPVPSSFTILYASIVGRFSGLDCSPVLVFAFHLFDRLHLEIAAHRSEAVLCAGRRLPLNHVTSWSSPLVRQLVTGPKKNYGELRFRRESASSETGSALAVSDIQNGNSKNLSSL